MSDFEKWHRQEFDYGIGELNSRTRECEDLYYVRKRAWNESRRQYEAEQGQPQTTLTCRHEPKHLKRFLCYDGTITPYREWCAICEAEQEAEMRGAEPYHEIVKRLQGAFIISGLGSWTEWQAAIDAFVKAAQAQAHLAMLASERQDRILELERELIDRGRAGAEAMREACAQYVIEHGSSTATVVDDIRSLSPDSAAWLAKKLKQERGGALLDAAKSVCPGCKRGDELRTGLAKLQGSTMRHFQDDMPVSHCTAEPIHHLRAELEKEDK